MFGDVTDFCFSDKRSSKASDLKLPRRKSQVNSRMAVKIHNNIDKVGENHPPAKVVRVEFV